MKRPRAHEVGDIAENIVAGAFLSHGWIVNRLVSDYGYDFLVSRLASGESTQSFALIQVKGTDRKIELEVGDEFCFRLSTDDLNYWVTTPIPVYVCIVEVATKNIFVFRPRDAVEALKARIGKEWRNSAYATLHVSMQSKLTEARATEIQDEVSLVWKELRELWQTALIAQGMGTRLYVSWLSGYLSLEGAVNVQAQLAEILGTKESAEFLKAAGLSRLEMP